MRRCHLTEYSTPTADISKYIWIYMATFRRAPNYLKWHLKTAILWVVAPTLVRTTTSNANGQGAVLRLWPLHYKAHPSGIPHFLSTNIYRVFHETRVHAPLTTYLSGESPLMSRTLMSQRCSIPITQLWLVFYSLHRLIDWSVDRSTDWLIEYGLVSIRHHKA